MQDRRRHLCKEQLRTSSSAQKTQIPGSFGAQLPASFSCPKDLDRANNGMRHFLLGCSVFWLLLSMLACSSPAPTAESCLKSVDCERKGLCILEAEKCVVGSSADCKKSRFCFELGLCTAKNGECLAATEQDCRNSSQCERNNRCIASSGECVELSTGYCRITNPYCKKLGECSLDRKNHVCIAKRDVDCKASEICQSEGKCSLDSDRGRCIVQSDDDCLLFACKLKGRCHAIGLTQKKCVPLNQSDCFQNQVCDHNKQESTRCVYNPEQETCSIPNEFCSSSENLECKSKGECSWSSKFHHCVAQTDKDCQDSDICKNKGACKAYHLECVTAPDQACQDSPFCALHGDCHVKDKKSNLCIPKTQHDCEQSYECWTIGHCQLKGEHCRTAGCEIPCQQFGRCELVQSSKDQKLVCIARSEQDCRASEACRRWGFCAFDEIKQTCVFSGKCDLPCRYAGRCTIGKEPILFPLLPTTMCVATSQSACQKKYSL